MTRARDIADFGSVSARLDTVGGSEGALSNRNLIINGAMMVAQRSTSVSSQTGSGYKTVDRIYTNASGSTYNQSQQTVTVGGETGLPTQFTKFLRHDVTTSNDNAHIYHKIEDVASVPEGTVTLSFYAKGTTPTGGLAFNAYQNFGTGGSPSGEVSIAISDTVTLTSTWQRFSVNITVPSITGKTLGTDTNSSHFYFGIGQFANTSTNAYQLDITGLQLEKGNTATPFEHKTFAQEFQACQRYFARSYAYGTATGASTSLGMRQTDYIENNQGAGYREKYDFKYPVQMRASPTITTYDTAGNSGKGNYYISAGAGNTNKTVSVGSVNATSFGGYSDRATTIGGWAIHYTADAEL